MGPQGQPGYADTWPSNCRTGLLDYNITSGQAGGNPQNGAAQFVQGQGQECLGPGSGGAALMEPLMGLEMPMRAPRQHLIHFSQGHQAFELVLPYFTRKGPKSRESLRPEVDAACRAGSVPPRPSVGEHSHHHHFRLGAGTSLPLQAPAGRHPHPTQWPGTGMLGSRPSPPWAQQAHNKHLIHEETGHFSESERGCKG